MEKIILFMVSIIALAGCGQAQELSQTESEEAIKSDQESGEINISAAASLQDALTEVTDKYGKEKGVKFNLNFGSSGALQSQIEEGASADIFFSAAQKQMKALVDGAFVDQDQVTNLLVNDVVLIVPKENDGQVKTIEDLAKDQVEIVALGDPESVPVGQYSQEILEHFDMADLVNSKASYGSDVRQVLNWVASGEVQAGFVYKTDAMIEDKVEIIESAPQESHKPVIYPAAVLKEGKNSNLAKDFMDYLKSDESIKVFEEYGFRKAD